MFLLPLRELSSRIIGYEALVRRNFNTCLIAVTNTFMFMLWLAFSDIFDSIAPYRVITSSLCGLDLCITNVTTLYSTRLSKPAIAPAQPRKPSVALNSTFTQAHDQQEDNQDEFTKTHSVAAAFGYRASVLDSSHVTGHAMSRDSIAISVAPNNAISVAPIAAISVAPTHSDAGSPTPLRGFVA